MSDDEGQGPTPGDPDRGATRNDLTIIVGHAQIVRRRSRLGTRASNDELIGHMDAIIKAGLRLGKRLDRDAPTHDGPSARFPER